MGVYRLIGIILFTIGLFIRFAGIKNNHPFWVDEFSTAASAKLILDHGLGIFFNNAVFIEHHNITTHLLTALSFSLFGMHEWSARLPFVLIGAAVPVCMLILTQKIFDIRTGLSAAFLGIFSYFFITWSRQARGYVLLQVCILLAAWLYFKLNQKDNRRLIIASFIIISFIGILTHSMFLIFLLAVVGHAIIFNRNWIQAIVKNVWFYVVLALTILTLLQTGMVSVLLNLYGAGDIFVNNVWYYHSFLWREYGLITFLSLAGFLIGLRTHKTPAALFALYTLIHLIFINFFFGPYTSRYLLPIFPLFFIVMSYAIVYLSDHVCRNFKVEKYSMRCQLLPMIIIFFIIANGHKFITKPKKFYTVNHDFREIALIDYHQVYGLIRDKGRLNEGKTAVIDTWNARTAWYLGDDFKGLYMFRWINPVTINGLVNTTEYKVNKDGEKIIPRINIKLIGELSDLKKAMNKYPRGFIYIDDTTLPQDVREYAEKNFKKELYVDHYTLDDNPYSIWPATLYSWGI